MGAPLFQLEQVSHCYGEVEALKHLSLRIDRGERVALIGPSGAGKSTVLGLLNGSLGATAGRVMSLGQDWRSLKPRQRRRIQRQIGMIYQQHHLVMNLAVVHNVNAGHLGHWSLARSAWSLVWPQALTQATQILERVGLGDKLYARTDRLSGGQQQRVALARVLVQDPVAILADEPVASLDPARAQDLMQLLCELTISMGKTLVISLHNTDLAFQYCTRLVGLRQGRLCFDAPPAQVTPAMVETLYCLMPMASGG